MLRRLDPQEAGGVGCGPRGGGAMSYAAPAADYPTRPVTIVVAFTPGGPSDVLSRIIGKRLQEILHQPFIVENRPGAGGNIAAEQVKNAAPDGYTLLMGNNSILATNAALYKQLSYDRRERFPADHAGRHPGQYPGGQPDRAGELDAGADRARQGEPGRAELRLVRSRRGRASRRRAVQDRGQDQHRPRRLQGRGARLAGRGRRSRADDVRHRRVGDRTDQARQGARARRDHADAHGAAAGPADRSTNWASRASTPPPGTASSRRPARPRRSSTRCISRRRRR